MKNNTKCEIYRSHVLELKRKYQDADKEFSYDKLAAKSYQEHVELCNKIINELDQWKDKHWFIRAYSAPKLTPVSTHYK